MIIDAHFHVWPDEIARKALGRPAEDLRRRGDGTEAGAREAMKRAGIDRAVAFGIANRPEHIDTANRYVASLDPEAFIPFGTIHPGASVEKNLSSLRENGLRGVKVHPLFQGYALDDPGLLELFEAMQGEFVVTTHVGEGGQGGDRCTPDMLCDLVERFPRLELIGCHFGGYRLLDELESKVIGLPVHLDTSWPPGLGSIDPGRLQEIIERHGPERIVFGSDWPMGEPAEDVAAVRALGFEEETTNGILGDNLARLLWGEVA
jgi:uncharacterized protein